MRKNNDTDILDVNKLDDALYWVDDVLKRCSMDYMLFGDTAYSIYNNLLPKYNKLNLGVLKKDCSEFSLSIIKMMIPDIEITDNKIKFEYNSIPIEIRIVNKTYPFFDNPQSILFKLDNYQIPNPFETYWKVYRLIQ